MFSPSEPIYGTSVGEAGVVLSAPCIGHAGITRRTMQALTRTPCRRYKAHHAGTAMQSAQLTRVLVNFQLYKMQLYYTASVRSVCLRQRSKCVRTSWPELYKGKHTKLNKKSWSQIATSCCHSTTLPCCLPGLFLCSTKASSMHVCNAAGTTPTPMPQASTNVYIQRMQ